METVEADVQTNLDEFSQTLFNHYPDQNEQNANFAGQLVVPIGNEKEQYMNKKAIEKAKKL